MPQHRILIVDDEKEIADLYEPWHYRYVGKEAAKEIHRRQTTLEEYLSR